MTQATEPDRRPPNRRQARTKVLSADGGKPFDLFDRRRQRIEALVDTPGTNRKRMALAMCSLDRCTDPDQLRHTGDKAGAKQIVDLTNFLIHRVKQRAGFGLQRRPFDPTPVPPNGDPSGLRELVDAVERRFRAALLTSFPPQVGNVFPIRHFEQTLAAFVGGEIRTGLLSPVGGDDDLRLHGVPDGANFFCFAEAALLFLHCRLATSFWRPLLRTFVGATSFFAAAYWNRTSRSWKSYSNEGARLAVPSAVILAAIDHTYAAMDPSQLADRFTEVVSAALRDDPTIPQPVAIAPELQ